MITIRLPNAIVKSQAACMTDCILAGAWTKIQFTGKTNCYYTALFSLLKLFTCVKENCNPVTENMTSATVMTKYCGTNHSMCTELGGVTWTGIRSCSNKFEDGVGINSNEIMVFMSLHCFWDRWVEDLTEFVERRTCRNRLVKLWFVHPDFPW